MSNLLAAVNDNLMMVNKDVLTCYMEEEFKDFLKAVSDALTKYITREPRFVEAVGKRTAKKTRFEASPICYGCDECGELQYVMRVTMSVDDKETDFLYDYSLIVHHALQGLEFATVVLYNNEGKSQLMQAFESEGNGVTSVKTFKNGRGENDTDDYLERIYAEILSEADLKVF